MNSNFKLVMAAALAGIVLGVAGLVFGIISKKKADELRSDFALVQGLVEKIQQVEDSSTGISASATRIRREVDSLRDGTQGALNQVSEELTRLRRDLNSSIALARGLEQKLAEVSAPPPAPTASSLPEPAPEPEVIAARQRPLGSPEASAAASALTAGESYIIRSGDNFSRIATAHGVTLASLLEANPGVDPLRLQVGQEIRLPRR
jgi:LysM repeat protein